MDLTGCLSASVLQDLQAQGFNCGSISKEERVQKRFIRAKEVRTSQSAAFYTLGSDTLHACSPCTPF